MKKTNRGSYTNRAKQEILDIETNEYEAPIPQCSFADLRGKDRVENSHPEGLCIHCDWYRSMEGKRWDDPDFIEAWDYDNYWLKFVRKPNALMGKEDLL